MITSEFTHPKVKIAALQMNANPAPCQDRLARAEVLVLQAAQQESQLVVLPEIFNAGYEYSDHNYELAEPLDGPTPTWMRRMAAQTGMHLAGTFLRRVGGEIYNTLLLAAPDGREWLYDKSYPWMFERAYFRPGDGPRIADTVLGKIGLLTCWDSAHPDLWRRYAGRVQLMLVCSSPPTFHDLVVVLPSGQRIPMAEFGPVQRHLINNAQHMFGACLRRQATWMGVPVVNTTGAGQFSSLFPSPRLAFFTMAASAPHLWDCISQAPGARIEAGYFSETYVADAAGQVLAQVGPNLEGGVTAEVALPASPSAPRGPQPLYGIPRLNYAMDALSNSVMAGIYARKVHAWGRNS